MNQLLIFNFLIFLVIQRPQSICMLIIIGCMLAVLVFPNFSITNKLANLILIKLVSRLSSGVTLHLIVLLLIAIQNCGL